MVERSESRNDNFDMPPYRFLKVFAFDPTWGETLGNHMTVSTRYEKLEAGPVGKYLEVIDYDATNKCYYLPVNLDDPKVMLRNGLDPSESSPQFHQQMVYAVASETIARFELALGRAIKWKPGQFKRKGNKEDDDSPKRLRIFPHGIQAANAFYSPDLGALVFGYFPATEADSGRNLPGQTVFTCLSHDIIAHETVHALIDSQRKYFDDPTSEDTLAFHEAFADIVALFQHFMFKEPLHEMIRKTGGQIFRSTVGPEVQPDAGGPLFQLHLTTDNPLVGLAMQFGEALGMRKALRSALGSRPNSKDLEKYHEPHKRGSILVAAVFDAFFSVYVTRTNDLMHIARAVRTGSSLDDLHPDIVNRLAETATKTATHFLNICIRALDYCPPVDIRFGDFLRAIITADFDLFPDDKYGYRATLIDAFRSRGIVPEGVSSYSEESLLWEHPGGLPRCKGLKFYRFDLKGKLWDKARENNAKLLTNFAKQNAEKLGLIIDPDAPDVKIWAQSFHEMHRLSDDGRWIYDIVVCFVQQREKVPLDQTDPDSLKFTFRGGTTVILDRDGQVRYVIEKPICYKKDDDKNIRLKQQREYIRMRQSNIGLGSYGKEEEAFNRAIKSDFSLTHRGY